MFYVKFPKKRLRSLALILVFIACSGLCALSINLETFWQSVQIHGGKFSNRDKTALAEVISNATGKSDLEKLHIINDYFQHIIRYQVDDVVWSKKDYWATPAELIAKRAGDCEDFAIAKYIFLLRLGIPATKLRLIYVKAKMGGSRSRITQAHMVLGYYENTNSSPLILDSLISDVLPANQRTDLSPVFSFNSEGLWSPGQKSSLGSSTARLSHWRSVLQKLNDEGITITIY